MHLVDYNVVMYVCSCMLSKWGTRREVGFLAICVTVADSGVSTTGTLEYYLSNIYIVEFTKLVLEFSVGLPLPTIIIFRRF